MSFTYKYGRPALTVDCVVFGLGEDDLRVLLIRRKHDPFADAWAFPGGFVDVGESVEAAARRELKEETGVDRVYLEQLYTFGEPDRDPREHVVTVAYYALVRMSKHTVRAATDARDARWFGAAKPPPLAFDHAAILEMAHTRLRAKVRYQPIGFELLPRIFPLRELQRLYEVILDRPVDKRNFRKRILDMGILDDLQRRETNVAHRAARLYRFNKRKYNRLVREGFHFEV